MRHIRRFISGRLTSWLIVVAFGAAATLFSPSPSLTIEVPPFWCPRRASGHYLRNYGRYPVEAKEPIAAQPVPDCSTVGG